MSPGPTWSKIGKYVLTALLASWTAIYTWATSYPDPKPWHILALLSFRIWVPIGAALLIVVLEIYLEVKYQASRTVLKKFLDHLHKKYFPHPTGGLNPFCRVTLFTPGSIRRKSLGVRSRSGGFRRTSKVRWSIKRSEAEDFHGIAGYAWALGIFVPIDGLPDYDNCSPEEKVRYLRETFATEKEVSRLHWKARSYRGLVVKNQRGDKIGVLMMESRQPDGLAHINADTFTGEAEYLQLLLA